MFKNTKLLSGFAAIAISFNAYAINIPSISSSTGYDEFKNSQGVVCRTATDAGTKLQVGVLHGNEGHNGNDYDSQYRRSSDESGVYMQIVVPIGSPDRIDCTRLYNIEIEKQQLELQNLRQQVEMMRRQAELAAMENLPKL